MIVSIIVAVAKNNVIGCANRLIWHISEDLKRFKALTSGHPIIMGRKTFESIGRVLPGRTNIVISRNNELSYDGVVMASSLEEALDIASKAEGGDHVFIIGGEQIYRHALESGCADRIYCTYVDQMPQGDAFFGPIDPEQWSEQSREPHDGFSFVDYQRIR